MNNLIEKSKKLFKKRIKKFGRISAGRLDPFGLVKHVDEVVKWADYLSNKHTQADRQIIMMAVWLHDIGHYPLPAEMDHAIRSEVLAKQFLTKEKFNKKKTAGILHCIRAHRCKDVMPQSIEAKIVACADSASHMTDSIYMDMARDDKMLKQDFRVYEKMKRDFRDVMVFPEVRLILAPLHRAWQKVIKEYEKIDL